MASDKENFALSGPSFLTSVDWNNSNHRRSVAASLVQGVRVLESDRSQSRGGHLALAPPWWESFGFKLHQVLIDDDRDQSYFAAVYEFNFPYPYPNYIGQRPPQYAIAFRGMIAKPNCLGGASAEDLKTTLSCMINNLHTAAGLAVAAKVATGPRPQDHDEAFVVLSSWVPYLFVSSSDMICLEYVGYFEHREKMEKIGAGKIGRLATKHSIGSIVSSSLGKKDSEPVHLLPSAYLTINTGELLNFEEAHGICQWWKPDLKLKYKLIQYK